MKKDFTSRFYIVMVTTKNEKKRSMNERASPAEEHISTVEDKLISLQPRVNPLGRKREWKLVSLKQVTLN